MATAWERAANAFRDLGMHSDAHAAYIKAGQMLAASAVSPGGVVAFSDLLTFPESSAAIVDSDIADMAHVAWASAASEAGKLVDSLKASTQTVDMDNHLEHKKAILRALTEQLHAWFEAGLCAMFMCCGSPNASPSLALRAFEAASSTRDRYEQEIHESSEGQGQVDMNVWLDGEDVTLFLNLGDLAFHFGHAYIRAGEDKYSYAAEEAATALSFYEKAETAYKKARESDGKNEAKQEWDGSILQRRRLTLSLQALAFSFMGQCDDVDKAIAAIGHSFTTSPHSIAKGPLVATIPGELGQVGSTRTTGEDQNGSGETHDSEALSSRT